MPTCNSEQLADADTAKRYDCTESFFGLICEMHQHSETKLRLYPMSASEKKKDKFRYD